MAVEEWYSLDSISASFKSKIADDCPKRIKVKQKKLEQTERPCLDDIV